MREGQMGQFEQDVRRFLSRKQEEAAEAHQLAAASLACGVDLKAALMAEPEARLALLAKLERAIERERLKGLRRHWSYDLNRHIALKQALDRLRGFRDEKPSKDGERRGGKANGARRRRQIITKP
jgi:hypothetical protein